MLTILPMIFESVSQFYIYTYHGVNAHLTWCLNSVLIVLFRGLLHDSKNLQKPSDNIRFKL